jgi:hypothetical protein
VGPGHGCERRAGYILLHNHVQIHPDYIESTESYAAGLSLSNRHNKTRILCAVYTTAASHNRIAAIVDTWGWKCDGFLAASTVTNVSLGTVDLPHAGPENYGNMWQKTRSMLAFLHDTSLPDFDYFYIAGDDTYLIVENLRFYLDTLTANETEPRPFYLGSTIHYQGETYVVGGSGYVLNRVALHRLVEEALPLCWTNVQTSAEDKAVGICLGSIGIHPMDTADALGRQRFLPLHPHWVATMNPYRRTQYMPGRPYWTALYQHWSANAADAATTAGHGPPRRHGLDVVSRHAIAFHHIKGPVSMRRLHAILYEACPVGTALHNRQPPQQKHDDKVIGPWTDALWQVWRNVKSVVRREPGIWGMIPCQE